MWNGCAWCPSFLRWLAAGTYRSRLPPRWHEAVGFRSARGTPPAACPLVPCPSCPVSGLWRGSEACQFFGSPPSTFRPPGPRRRQPGNWLELRCLPDPCIMCHAVSLVTLYFAHLPRAHGVLRRTNSKITSNQVRMLIFVPWKIVSTRTSTAAAVAALPSAARRVAGPGLTAGTVGRVRKYCRPAAPHFGHASGPSSPQRVLPAAGTRPASERN